MRMAIGLRTLLLNLSLILFLFLSFSAYGKTLKVDTVTPSVSNGDFTITPNGSGGIVLGSFSGVLKGSSGTVSAGTVDLTSEINGILGIANGGTNLSSTPTNGQLLIGDGVDYTLSTLTATTDETSITNGSGSITVGIADDPVLPGSGAVTIPSGADGTRPGTPAVGMLRYNTTSNTFEGYKGASPSWGAIGGSGGGGLDEWVTATSYAIDDIVWYDGLIYQSQTAHTSGTFATDLANGDWIEMTNTIPLMSKGSILTSNGTDNGEFTACPDGEVLIADSSQTSGFICKPHATEALTNWTAFTMGIVDSTGANVKSSSPLTDTAFWKREGDDIIITFSYYHQTTVGSAGTGTYYLKLPNSLNVDVSKITAGGGNSPPIHGSANGDVGGGTLKQFLIVGNNALGPAIYDKAANTYVASGTSYAFNNTYIGLSGEFRIPVSGWTSNNSVTAFDCDGLECENEFTAYVDASGNVSRENVNWIDGNCSISGTSIFQCDYVSGLTNSPLNCTASIEQNTNDLIVMIRASTSTAVTTYTDLGSVNSATPRPHVIRCSRQGSDYNQYNHRFAKIADDSMSEWTSYTPTLTGFGTASSVDFQWRRVGDSIEISGKFTSGTATAVEAQIGLPSTYTIDSTKYSGVHIAGLAGSSASGTTGLGVIATGGDAYFNINQYEGNTSADDTPLNGNSVAGSGHVIYIKAKAAITGWTAARPAFITGNISETTFTETVKTEGATNPVTYSFKIGQGTVNTNCTSHPCSVYRDKGSLVSSADRDATGNYSINLNTGKFSEAPVCVCSSHMHGIDGQTTCGMYVVSATELYVYTGRLSTSAAVDTGFYVTCNGVK